MKIDHIKLENYRIFNNATIDFDPHMTVLIGPNGSGKSSILDAISIFLKRITTQKNHIIDSNLDINDVKINCDNVSLKYNYYIDKNLHHQYDLLYKKNNDRFIDEEAHIKAKFLFDEIEHVKKQVSVYYTSKRIIGQTANIHNIHANASKEYAFLNAFDEKIDFPSTLIWFTEKCSEEALTATRIKDLNYKIPELVAVREAVSAALGEYNEPYVDCTPPQLFITHKNAPDVPLNLNQLSDGYRTMLALVMDLARRMVLANTSREKILSSDMKYSNPLHDTGFVLIDEVELHLHPAWQQKVLPSLHKIFPNIQFIVTTHSPQIISSVQPQQIRLIKDGKVYLLASSTYGAESQRILEEVFGVSPRPDNEAKKKLDAYFELINRGEYDTEKAKQYRNELDEWLNGDPALDYANMLIRRDIRKQERSKGDA